MPPFSLYDNGSNSMSIFRIFIALLFIFFSAPILAKQDIKAFELTYDAEQDHVNIHSNGSRLKTILGSLAIRTGIETFLHPDADRLIDFNIQHTALETAIKNLCKQLNCIISYETDKTSDKTLMIGLSILPSGNEESEMLHPVVPLSTELSMHARMHQSENMHKLIQKRLAIRLSKLPAEQQQEVLTDYQNKIKHHKERTERRDRLKRERREKWDARRKQQHERLEAIQESDPAAYDTYLQRQQQAELLYGPGPATSHGNH